MHHISENNIKKVSLRFLKTYYKFRPRVGETTFSQDLKTDSGIIADGQMSFPTDTGGQFTATFEATSYATRDEVIYKLQNRILFWDSLAVSCLLAAFLFSYGFAYQHFTVAQMGLGGSLSLLGLVLVIVFYVYHLLFRNQHKYRYIYAIEQFKRYHADEQWIAISTDIFEHPDDGHFKELKAQCVLNGIGLVAVDPDLEPHMLITPSRQELFGQSRKRMTFKNQNNSKTSKASKKMRTWWNQFVNRVGKSKPSSSLLRYQRSHFMQIALCMVSLFMLSGIYYEQLRDKSTTYVDETDYEQTMKEKNKKLFPEAQGYIVDSADMRTYRKLNTPYQSEEEPLEDEDIPTKPDQMASQAASDEEIYVSSEESGAYTRYECERFYNIKGTVYIVQDRAFKQFEDAQKRIAGLKKRGVETSALWLGCFTKKDKRYVVYYDMMFESRSEAKEAASDYRKRLKRKRLASDNVLIRSISRIK